MEDAGAGTGRRGLRRPRRGQAPLRGLRRRRPDPAAHADLDDRPCPLLEGAGPVPGPALPGGHLRRARQRPLGPAAGTRALRLGGAGPVGPGGAGRDRDRAGRAGVAVDGLPVGAVADGAAAGTGGGQRVHRPVAGHRARTHRTAAALRGALHLHRRLGQVQPVLLAGPLPGLPRVLLLPVLHRAALHQADRGRRRLGAGDVGGGAAGRARRQVGRRGDPAGLVCRQPLPGPGHPRRRGRHQPAAAGRGAGRGRRRRPDRPGGGRSHPHGPRPGQGQPADPTVHRVAWRNGQMTTLLSAPEQTRARYPDEEGFVDRDGVRVFCERYGEGEPTVLLPPTWEIVHSRFWKAQIPYLARHTRVVIFDPRGNGRSDRPDAFEAYARREFAADALAVLDAAGVDRAVVVSWCDMGESLLLAAEHPERVAGLVFIAPPLSDREPDRGDYPFDSEPGTDEGWAKETRGYWLRDWPGYLEFFFATCFTEPHSTKQVEDSVGWAGDTDMETILAGFRGWETKIIPPAEVAALGVRVRCPVLVIHGTEDAQSEVWRGEELARLLDGRLVLLESAGHAPHARDPVKVNELVAEFAGVAQAAPATRTWTRALRRPKRALYLSSPIGLGHARRDLAIARELRRQVPGLEIDWLAQDPVTRVLEAEGERIHPASAWLANESAHIERESAEHDLHAFQAIRRMDEILIANFMVFHDVVREQPYDLWIGDEAWELDYFLHENPEEKRAAYVWLTDFVGWLPMPDGGEREAFLTADYNAEMIEQIARYPRVRDRAIFVGNPDDVVPERFGSDLPAIRDWTEQHYDFAGYVTGFDPDGLGEREELRRDLGYRDDEQVCIVTVGGSGVGGHLLRRVIEAFPEAKRQVPALRMIVVAGPRIDPASLLTHDGLEVRAFVPQLYRHLAACDLAVVQGGLSTCME